MRQLISEMLGLFEQGAINRRQLIECLTGIAVTAQAAAAGPESTFRGLGLNHIALRVTDVGRSRDFYRKHFGMPIIRDEENSCFLGLGDHFLALFRGDTPRMDHYCIAIDKFTADSVVDELKRQGLKPDRPSGSSRVYFPDPDGLTVQVSAIDHHA
jgi:catechol 2,3-dioxygenase-like lactoylglutathione lyase family enzyme